MLLHGLLSASSRWYFASAVRYSLSLSGTSPRFIPLAISSRASSPSSQLGTMTRASRRATGAANAAPWESDARSGWIVASALMPTSAPPTTAMDPFNPPVTTRRLMRSRVPRSRESNGPLGFSGSGSSPSGDGPPLPLMDRSRVSFVVVGSKGFPSASGSFPSPSSEEALGTMDDRPPNRRDPRRCAGDLRTLAPETTARALIAHRALIADASPGAISSLNPRVSSTGRSCYCALNYDGGWASASDEQICI